MARAIDADELKMFPYSEGSGTEEQIAEWIEQVGLSEDDTAGRARDLCWKVIDGFINVVKTQPTLTPPNEPLTLEELREMDEPVWVACKPIEGGNGYWCLCQHGHIITPAGSIYDVKEIPHWVFYRRPPEGEADA